MTTKGCGQVSVSSNVRPGLCIILHISEMEILNTMQRRTGNRFAGVISHGMYLTKKELPGK
jgi:hypothetical protein